MNVRFLYQRSDDVVDLLRRQFQQSDRHPDVIHVIGTWTWRAHFTARRARKTGMPVIYTPHGTLNEWMPRRWPLPSADVFIAMSDLEQATLEKKGLHPHLLLNPLVTSRNDEAEFIRQTRQLYETAGELIDRRIQEEIRQETERTGVSGNEAAICRQVLSVRHHLKRGGVSPALLQEMDTLLRSDYDEPALCKALDKLHVRRLTGALETVMTEETGLTEGFMPVSPVGGRLAGKIKNAIIHE